MHGLDIAHSLIGRIIQEADKQKLKRLSKVYIELGSRCGIGPEELDFCLKVLSKDTLIGGSTFQIDITDSNQIFIDSIEGE